MEAKLTGALVVVFLFSFSFSSTVATAIAIANVDNSMRLLVELSSCWLGQKTPASVRIAIGGQKLCC